jgi:hypothetical protein
LVLVKGEQLWRVERILLDPRRRGSAMALKSLVVGKLGARDLYIAIWEYMSRGCFHLGKAFEGLRPTSSAYCRKILFSGFGGRKGSNSMGKIGTLGVLRLRATKRCVTR